MLPRSWCCALLCFLSGTAELGAQNGTRERRVAAPPFLSNPSYGIRPPDGELRIRYPKQPELRRATALTFPAAALELRDAADVLQEVLFSGRDAEHRGLLLRFRVRAPNAASWQLEDQCVLPDRDLVGIAHARSNGTLYALDATNAVILRASWSSGTPLPPASSWTEVASFGDLADDVQLELCGLSITSDGAPVVLRSSLVSAEGCIATEEERRFFEIVDEGRSVSLRLVVRPREEPAPKIAADRLELSCTELPVRGAAGTEVEIVRLDARGSAHAIARGRLDETGRGTLRFADPSDLAFGAVYAARVAGSARAHGPFLAAERVWPSGADRLGTHELRWGGSLAVLAYPGSRVFASELELQPHEAARERAPRARLLLGTERDAILTCGRAQLLDARHVIAGSPTRVALPIPAESRLGGSELRLQWIVEDGDALALSSIRGLALRREAWLPPEAPAFLASMASSAPPDEPANTREEAWERWMRALRAKPFSLEERSAIEQRLVGH
ncbi:MAG: hypothetical protein JNM84_21055 [Planctomycetes bacterium]|nr:hypothetical protein [Planctomycetota bacterium]